MSLDDILNLPHGREIIQVILELDARQRAFTISERARLKAQERNPRYLTTWDRAVWGWSWGAPAQVLAKMGITDAPVARALSMLRTMGLLETHGSRTNKTFTLTNPDLLQKALAGISMAKTGADKTRYPQWLSDVVPRPRDVESFQEILAKLDGEDVTEGLWKMICPYAVPDRFTAGRREVKRAILHALASGWDKGNNRNRIHILLKGYEGDPDEGSGTAKTIIASWMEAELGAVIVAGASTTKSGLRGRPVAGVIKDCPLLRAHKRPLFIDEIEKMDKDDRKALLQARDPHGRVRITMDDRHGTQNEFTYKSTPIVVAAANDISMLKPYEMRGYDLVFDVDQPDTPSGIKIAGRMVESWDMPAKQDFSGKLRRYLAWVYGRPMRWIDRDAIKRRIAKHLTDLGKKKINITLDFEVVMRIARANARLNYEDVGVKHIDRAIELIRTQTKARQGR